MTAYVLAQMSIHDRPRYDSYASRFLPTLRAYDGRLLVADERPELIEGTFPMEKVVLIEFPDRDTAMRWMQSDAYQEISKDRVAATTGVTLFLQGR
jgi:uncharacterized protein (DUF1330 family)